MWTLAILGWALIAPPAPGPEGLRPVPERAFTVALDAGHGGENGGCVAFDGTTREKQLTLALVAALQADLHDRLPHAQVITTRSGDEGVPLAERVQRANAAGAAVFVSVHANASEDRDQQGFETYVLDVAVDSRETARLARRDNDGAPGAIESSAPAAAMVRQLGLSAQRGAAVRLAVAIQAAWAGRFPERVDRGVKEAPFDVLMGTRMPSVLVEVGFLDHREEGALLLKPATQAAIVAGLADAIVEHYRSEARLR